MKSRCFLIADIDTKMIVEETTRKDIIGYIEEYLENIEYGNDMSDYHFVFYIRMVQQMRFLETIITVIR